MRRSLISAFICCICLPVLSQEVPDTIVTPKIPEKYFDAVSKKANTLHQNIDKKSQEVLDRMQKQEVKLQRKLAKIISLATHIITDVIDIKTNS